MKKLLILLLAFLASPAFAQSGGNGPSGQQIYLPPTSTPNQCAVSTVNPYIGTWAACGAGGGISSFSFTNGGGFAGVVTNPTTTPALALTVNAALPLFGYTTAGLPACTSGSKGLLAYTTDGTAALTFCNGSTWVNNGGTQFTFVATGCTPSASSGDATGGSITLAAGPCTQLVITFNGAVGMTASHLWVCSVSDPALNGPTSWFGSWGASSSTTTTATIQIPPAVGATDTITFSCEPH